MIITPYKFEMDEPMSNYEPPIWVKSESTNYKRWLNKMANRVVKHKRKYGESHNVKQTMDSIHQAMQLSDGIDPYDGTMMKSELIDTYMMKGCTLDANSKKEFFRMPTIKYQSIEQSCVFEIMSMQTNEAKGEMSHEEYLNHCRAVVNHYRVEKNLACNKRTSEH